MLRRREGARAATRSRAARGATSRALHPALRGARRAQRILDSLRVELAGEGACGAVRVRRILSEPVEVFRLEFERPELSYQRVTLLDRDCLEELLETDGVRDRGRPEARLLGRVPGAGLEPARPYGQAILSRPRLPVPPPGPRRAYSALPLSYQPVASARHAATSGPRIWGESPDDSRNRIIRIASAPPCCVDVPIAPGADCAEATGGSHARPSDSDVGVPRWLLHSSGDTRQRPFGRQCHRRSEFRGAQRRLAELERVHGGRRRLRPSPDPSSLGTEVGTVRGEWLSGTDARRPPCPRVGPPSCPCSQRHGSRTRQSRSVSG